MKRFLLMCRTLTVLILTTGARAKMSARQVLEMYDQGDAIMRAAIAHDSRYAGLPYGAPYGATIMFVDIHRFPCP